MILEHFMNSILKENKCPVSFSSTTKDIQMGIFFILNMCVGKIFRKKHNNNYVWEKRLSWTWHTAKDKESFPVHLQVISAAYVQYLLSQVTKKHSFSARETQWEVGCHCVSVIWDNGITVWLNTIDDQRNDSTNSSLGDQRVTLVTIRLLKEYRWFKVTCITEPSPAPTTTMGTDSQELRPGISLPNLRSASLENLISSLHAFTA